MKKILLCLFSVLCVFTLVACGNPTKPVEPPVEPPVDETDEYVDEVKTYLDKELPSEVSSDFELPGSYTFKDETFARITWETSNERTINTKGRYTQNLFDEEIVLTGKVMFLDIEHDDYTYEKTVKTTGKEDINEYKKIIEDRIPDYVYRDFEVVTRDTTYKKYNYFGEITYTSSDTSVLEVETKGKETFVKYVNMEPTDQTIDLNYKVVINEIIVCGKKTIKVEARQDEKYISEAKAFLDKYFTTDMVYIELDLPETDDNGRVGITWRSSDPVIIDHSGVLHVYEPNKTVTMTATINYNGTVQTWEKQFHTFKDGELLDFIVNRMHRDVIQQYVMEVYAYDTDNYGFLPFYVQDLDMQDIVTDTTPNNAKINYVKTSTHNKGTNLLEVETGLVPWNNMGRPQRMKPYTQIITVHDTGDAHHSAEWWNELEKTNDQRETSWNFTVGENKIYQHIPINEVAWHAGDGRTEFKLIDTGIKFDGYDPEITLGKDHYLHINGKKSLVPIPTTHGVEANDISGAGLYTCVGSNGNYWMGDVYASGYSSASKRYYVCTRGGNSTGIGIETDIHQGVDYNQVLRNCSNLVGNLLVYFNLDPSRVLQHRHFSGKLCPQVMIENGTWPEFLRMVQNEYLIKKYMNGLKLEYTTSDETLLSNTGKVLKKVESDTTVTYTVKATYMGEVKTYNFSTVIKPIPTKVEK